MMTDSNLGYREHYDFEPIYKAIKTYYPIDLYIEGESRNVQIPDDYPGLVKLRNVFHENFKDQKTFLKKWGSFKKYLKKELKKPLEMTIDIFCPCYSGFIVLKQVVGDAYKSTKELHFYISLLGPFYSIQGLDRSEISLEVSSSREPDKKWMHGFPAYHAVTVSPYSEYEESFRLLEQKIEKYFPGYRFVPFETCKKKIPGISAYNSDVRDDIKDSIYSALFNSFRIFEIHARGDSRYGTQKWLRIIEGLEETLQSAKELMLQNAALVKQDEISLHKVWKFKSFNKLAPIRGLGLFGMDSIDLIDLTNKTTVTLINEHNKPIVHPYFVSNEEIHFRDNHEMIFKVSGLSASELRLTLNINIKTENGKQIHGDVVEICFETFGRSS